VLDLAGHPIVEAGPDGDEHVGLVHGHVGFVGPVHPQHAQELWVRHGIGPKAHQRAGDREAGETDQLRELRGRLAEHHATARVDHRPLGLEHQVDRPADLPRMTPLRRMVGAHPDLPRIVIGHLDVGVGDVLGHVHHHGSRAPRGGDVEGLADSLRQLVDILDQEIVLDAGSGDPDRIHLLEGVRADHGSGYLTRNHHHGDGVHVGGGDSGHRIGGTGTGGDEADPALAGCAGVTVRGVSGTLLVTDEDVLDPLLLEEGVVDVQHGPARVAEDELDALVDQGLDDDLGT